MEPIAKNLLRLQNKNAPTEKVWGKASLSDVMKDRNTGFHLNETTLFLIYFNEIPNKIIERNINCKRAAKWFTEIYEDEIKDMYFNKRYFKNNKNAEYDDIFCILYDDLIVDFDTNCDVVRFLFKTTNLNKVDKIIGEIKRFRIRQTKQNPQISLLFNTSHGIDIKKLSLTRPKLDIESNYNNDFIDIHQTIIKRLSKKNDKGIVLLHGKPGTGKTSYIRFLIYLLKKNVIFLPPTMASSITNLNLMSILIDNPNSIFVIEDAENILIDREQEGQSGVSTLLNISDGLLSDCLNIQIICSFNTDISKVDSALLRKGRLIAKYEFKELEVQKAQTLSDKLGFTTKLNLPMTLTAIYNQEERDFQQREKRKAIGFKAIVAN